MKNRENENKKSLRMLNTLARKMDIPRTDLSTIYKEISPDYMLQVLNACEEISENTGGDIKKCLNLLMSDALSSQGEIAKNRIAALLRIYKKIPPDELLDMQNKCKFQETKEDKKKCMSRMMLSKLPCELKKKVGTWEKQKKLIKGRLTNKPRDLFYDRYSYNIGDSVEFKVGYFGNSKSGYIKERHLKDGKPHYKIEYEKNGTKEEKDIKESDIEKSDIEKSYIPPKVRGGMRKPRKGTRKHRRRKPRKGTKKHRRRKPRKGTRKR